MRRDLKDQALAILKEGQDLTLATACEDGWPYASTVSYASDGLRIYFGCGADSLKARNLKRDPRASVTVDLPHGPWSEIRGLCLSARGRLLNDMDEIAKAGALFAAKFPKMSDFVAEPYQSIRLFELTPVLISVLDYSKGFGHVDHAEVEPADLAAA
jgi:hypothetical protein